MIDVDIRTLAHRHAIACLRYAVAKRTTAQLARPPRPRKPRKAGRSWGAVTQAILDYLEHNEPANADEIADALGRSVAQIRGRCIDMKHDGRLVHFREGRGNVGAVYALAESRA